MTDHISSAKRTPHIDDTTVALLHALPDPALLIDADGTILALNDIAAPDRNNAPADLIGTSLYDMYPLEVAAQKKKRIEEVVRSRKPLHSEESFEGRRVVHSLYPIFDKQGVVRQIAAVARDITEEQKVQREHQLLSDTVDEQTRLLESIVSATDDILFVCDRHLRYTYANKAGSRFVGVPVKNIIGKTWRELGLAPKRMRPIEAKVEYVFASGERITGETTWPSSAGGVRYLEYVLTPIIGQGGIVISVLVTARDITERRLAEDKLRQESLIDAALAALYAPLIDSTSDIADIMVAVRDQARALTGSEHGYVSIIDPETRNLVSYSHTRMVGKELCTVPEEKKGIVFPIGPDGRYNGLYGHALNTKQAFYTNAPAEHSAARGTPEGHITLQRFLAVPVLIGEELVGDVNVANADRDYTEEDVDAVRRLGEFYALAIQRKRAEESLQKIEWLLTRQATPRDQRHERHIQPYGDVTELNTSRIIADSVGGDVLADIVDDYLELLDTSAAVYERDGSYALGLFSSGWCRLLDLDSRERCRTDDNAEALRSGKWLCHESCWTDASRVSIEKGKPVDIKCNGEIQIYAVPIYAGETLVGSMNFGYGDPPTDPATLQVLADRYGTNIDDLRGAARAYLSRPPYIVELAKDRLMTSARLVGEMVHRKQTEAALQRAHDGLEQRVGERTRELQNEIEERKVIEEELQTTTEELLDNVKELRRAEQSAQEHARKMGVLNQVIQASNEAIDVASLASVLVDRTIDLLNFDAGALFLFNEAQNVIKLQYARGYSPDYAKERARVSVDEPHLIRLYRDHEPLWSEHLELAPHDVIEREHIPALAVIPLIVRGRIIGDLGISSRREHQFTEAEKDLFLAIGREAGTAIAKMQAEEEVRAASLYSRSLLEASLDPLVTISAEGKITDVNKATEDVTGFSREELIGTDFSSYFTEPERAREGYQQAFTEGFVRDYPLAIRHTSGKITDVLYHATVYRNDVGEIEGVFATAWDITELKLAEENLRRAHDELEQIVQERTRDLQEEVEEHKVTEEELRETTDELRRSNKELEQFAYIACT